jgi:putative ABC transport system permease protein
MVGQFTASIILIIGTVTITRQLDYLRTKDLGFNRDYVVVVPTNKNIREGFALGRKLKTEIEKNPAVRHSSLSLYSMAEYGWMNLGYMDNKDVFRQFTFNTVDADFVPTMGLQIVQGRSFSNKNPADSNYILVNEALVKEYGWKDPIGQRLPGKYEHRVLGVVRDFHVVSLHEPIGPVVMAIKPDSIFSRSSDISMEFSPKPRLSIRFQRGNPQENIDFLRKAWKSVSGDQDFEYSFLDDALASAYQQEERLGKIVRYASGFSIFIACMGLFGLSAFSITQRVKEIGIRKVLGARITSIVALLSKDFLLLVGIAALIAFPLAWFALHEWLTDFAYRIQVSWWVFIAAGLSALIIALATVGIQAVKAALSNPVKSLRTE